MIPHVHGSLEAMLPVHISNLLHPRRLFRNSPKIVLALSSLVVALSAGVARSDDWPMFRHDPAHTGASTESLKAPFALAWSYPAKAKGIISSAAVVGGSVYFGTRDDPKEADAPFLPSPNGGGIGSLYCLDAATGKLKWRFNKWKLVGIGWVDSSPAVVEDRVYFSARDGYFYCVGTDGKEIWRTKTGGTYDSSSPTVVNGKIFLSSGYPNKDFFCLKASDGSILWRTPSGNAKRPGQYAYSSPAVDGDVVYVGANDAVFYALNAATGEVKWRYESSGTVYYYSPTISDNRLYCAPGEFNPHLYAVDLKTGAERWKFSAAGQYFFTSSPAVSNGVLYWGAGSPDQMLYAIKADDGTEKWHANVGFSTAQGFTSSPAVAGSLILVGAGPDTAKSEQNGHLFALDAATGEVKWQTTLPKPVVASPAVSNGMVFVGAMDGTMRAYKASGSSEPLESKPKKPKSDG